MTDLVWLIPLFPLLGFATILLFGRRLGEPLAGYLATGAVFASFAATAAIYVDMLGKDAHDRADTVTLWSWVPVGELQVDFAFLARRARLDVMLTLFALLACVACWKILVDGDRRLFHIRDCDRDRDCDYDRGDDHYGHGDDDVRGHDCDRDHENAWTHDHGSDFQMASEGRPCRQESRNRRFRT